MCLAFIGLNLQIGLFVFQIVMWFLDSLLTKYHSCLCLYVGLLFVLLSVAVFFIFIVLSLYDDE